VNIKKDLAAQSLWVFFLPAQAEAHDLASAPHLLSSLSMCGRVAQASRTTTLRCLVPQLIQDRNVRFRSLNGLPRGSSVGLRLTQSGTRGLAPGPTFQLVPADLHAAMV